MLSNHLIFCQPLLLLPSIFLSIRLFSSESPVHIRWPKYWSFSFSISPSSEYSGFPWGLTGLISLQSKEESSSAPQFESIRSLTHRLLYCPTLICVCVCVRVRGVRVVRCVGILFSLFGKSLLFLHIFFLFLPPWHWGWDRQWLGCKSTITLS